MKQVLVTGSEGFLGRNLMQALSEREDLNAIGYDIRDTEHRLLDSLRAADVVVHLAGVNRPVDPAEYEAGNVGFTRKVCDLLRSLDRRPRIIMSSSVQAALDNPYGISKRNAEQELRRFADETCAEMIVFRFKNIFGKWSRPNYNSVVATFCHNASRGLPLEVHDPDRTLELVFVDDVVEALVDAIDSPTRIAGLRFADEINGFRVTLGNLAEVISSFTRIRAGGVLPDLADGLTKHLYSTYLAYLEASDLAYPLEQKMDSRGSLAEFIKSPHTGQLFLSRTKPGITRGNHYHHSKVEKFLVVEGRALIRLRNLATHEIVEYEVLGQEFRVVDIPPGYTHSIQNTGDCELVVLFWANEVFDPFRPDTFFCEVG
jgi:UDP-2-acetamido-2,6-beta-L-arabino-hexul-4-ose reductase